MVASTKSGQEQIEDRGELSGIERGFPELVGGVSQLLTSPPPPPTTDTMDFSGLSLIKLKKQEMETQVRPSPLTPTAARV